MKLIKKFTPIILALASILIILPNPAFAADTKTQIQCGVNNANGISGCTAQPTNSLDSTIKTIINILSSLVGVIAVIMIIVAGFRYVTSGGDSNKVSSAKSALMWAIIGLAIVALAQVIARFTLHAVT